MIYWNPFFRFWGRCEGTQTKCLKNEYILGPYCPSGVLLWAWFKQLVARLGTGDGKVLKSEQEAQWRSRENKNRSLKSKREGEGQFKHNIEASELASSSACCVTKPSGFCHLHSPDPQGRLFIFTAMLSSDLHDLSPSHALCLHSHALQIYLLHHHQSDLLKREL